MPLTPAEKAAGRRFRDDAQAALLSQSAGHAPTYTVPHFLGLYRHLCPRREGRSTALDLRERYATSPAYDVYIADGQALAVAESEGPPPVWATGATHTQVPAGRFGFIYRQGTCRGCGQTARSNEGRLVDGWERPPIQGRVARS